MLSEASSSRDRDRPSTPLLAQIILFDGFDLLDALGPYEVFQAAALVSEGSIKVELVSTEGARMVPSAPGGLLIEASGHPDLDLARIMQRRLADVAQITDLA